MNTVRSPFLGAYSYYTSFATPFSQIGVFLDTHGNTISHENFNSGSDDNYAKHETS